MYINSRLTVIKVTGQMKAFSRQKIPEPSCARKENLIIDMLITSRNGERFFLLLLQNRCISCEFWKVWPTDNSLSDKTCMFILVKTFVFLEIFRCRLPRGGGGYKKCSFFRKIWRFDSLKHPFWDSPFCLSTDVFAYGLEHVREVYLWPSQESMTHLSVKIVNN